MRHPPLASHRAPVLLLAALAAACAGERSAPSAPPAAPRFEVQDGATGGNPGFHFLPPLVANPTTSGTFDGSLSPTVLVCEWTGGQCGAVVAQFSRTGGTGAETVRVDATAQQYVVNWQTDQCVWGACTLDPAKTYRVRVRVGTAQLGFADVQVFSSAKEARNASTGGTVALVNGRTLPLKFRIAQGAVAVVDAGGAAPVGASGGVVATAGGALSVAVPGGALATTVPISATPVAPATLPAAPGLVPGSAFEMGPDGTQFAKPVTLAVAYDPAALPAGVQPAMLRLFTVQGGSWVQVPGSRVDPVTRTVSGEVSHFSTYAVLPQRVRWAPGQPSLGVDQVVRQDVLLSEPPAADVAFTLQNRNAVLTVGEPGTSAYATAGTTVGYVMPAGASFKTFFLYSDRLGADTLVLSAAGYLPDTLVMPVVRGKVLLTGWPATLQAGDSVPLTLITTYPSGNYAGVAHPKTFALAASPNLRLTQGAQPVASIELSAGAYQSATFYVKVVGDGPATLSVTNADYEPLTASLTAVAPRLRFAAGQRAVGLGQVTGQDVVIPAAVAAPVAVALTNRNGALTIAQGGTANYTYGGQTGTYAIPAGQTFVRLTMIGEALGTDTLIASAPGYLPDTVVILGTLGKLLVTGLPSAPLAAGDSVALTIIQTLPSGTYTSAGHAETYQLSAGPNAVLTENGHPISSIAIGGFQSGTFYLKATAAGGGTLSVTNPHYEPVAAAFATFQTWDLARDFPATNPGGTWSAGWTATLGAPFNRYPDYVVEDPFVGWTEESIRDSGTPYLFKNVSALPSGSKVPAGFAVLHPGCRANEFSLARWTAPADATYEVAARFYQGDDGNTTAHVLKNGSAASPLFATTTTNGSPQYAGSVALLAGETLDFVVGVAEDYCYGDTTPLSVTITRR